MSDFHGIDITLGEGGVRPFTTPGQSTLGVVLPATPAVDGEFGDGTNPTYNQPNYITEIPSTDDLPDNANNAFALQVLDQIFRQGRIPTQVVFVPIGAAQTARAEQTFTSRELAAATVDTKAELDALTDPSFAILSIGSYKYLAFNDPADADVTKFNLLNPGDKINIQTGNTIHVTYTVERDYSAANAWFRVNDDADVTGLTAGTDYVIKSPATEARTAAENEYDNLLGRQHAQTGIYALRAANPTPKILFVGHKEAARITGGAANGLATSLANLAAELDGMVVLDGPGTDLDDILIAATLYSGDHIYMMDPWIYQAYDEDNAVPASPTVAASIAVNDYERGYWTSPSNKVLAGVLKTNRDISYGFEGSEADVLNDSQIATIIKDGGFRLWGNEGLNMIDPTYRFLQIYRTRVAIEESLRTSLKWAIAQNITVRFFENVAQSCNAFLKKLQNQGAITGGECYPDRQANTAANIKAGIASFVVRWSGVYPAQTIRVKLEITDDFLEANLLNLI